MPAYNDTLDLPKHTYVLVTASAVAEITFKNVGLNPFWIVPAIGAVVPTDRNIGFPVLPGEGMNPLVLAETFRGMAGADRIYVISPYGSKGWFSHA